MSLVKEINRIFKSNKEINFIKYCLSNDVISISLLHNTIPPTDVEGVALKI